MFFKNLLYTKYIFLYSRPLQHVTTCPQSNIYVKYAFLSKQFKSAFITRWLILLHSQNFILIWFWMTETTYKTTTRENKHDWKDASYWDLVTTSPSLLAMHPLNFHNGRFSWKSANLTSFPKSPAYIHDFISHWTLWGRSEVVRVSWYWNNEENSMKVSSCSSC